MNTPVNIPALPVILLTGATGNVGSEVAKQLVAKKLPFRAMVRQPGGKEAAALRALPGATLVQGDFNDAASVAAALAGVERAFLLTNSSAEAEGQQLSFVAQAQRAGVRQLVKLSQWAASPDSPVRFLRYHAVVEQAIRDTGLDFTFLRPNLFMQGLLGFKDSITKQHQFFAAIGEVPVSVVDVRDIAAAAVAALTGPGHAGKIYDLTGPEALTHAQMAAGLSQAMGYPITFVDVTPEVMRDALLGAGFPEWQADGLLEDYAHYHLGEAATVTPGVEQATGQAPHDFASFAHEYAADFK